MTKAMPEIIKENFIYSSIWNGCYKKSKGASFLFLGQTGNGKSYAGLRWCEDLDENFCIDNVVFTSEEFIDLVKSNKLKIGSCILFDEVSVSADSRSAMTKQNKILSWLISTIRFKRFIIIYSCPSLAQVDSNVRKINVTGICIFKKINFKEKVSIADFRWSVLNPLKGEQYLPHPRLKNDEGELTEIVSIEVPLPSKEIIKLYEEKKNNFFENNLLDWSKALKEKPKKALEKVDLRLIYKKALKEIDSLLNSKGQVSLAKIRLKYNLSMNNTSALGTLLNDYRRKAEEKP